MPGLQQHLNVESRTALVMVIGLKGLLDAEASDWSRRRRQSFDGQSDQTKRKPLRKTKNTIDKSNLNMKWAVMVA